MRMDQILAKLSRLRPGGRTTAQLRMAGEHALLKMLNGRGLRAIERLVAELNARGHRFQPDQRGVGTRTWREVCEGGERAIDIYVASTRSFRAASLRYLDIRKPELTPAEQKRAAVQKRFYDRYMEIGQRAYRDSRYRLTVMDRRLLLVGELEADVNNGGFS